MSTSVSAREPALVRNEASCALGFACAAVARARASAQTTAADRAMDFMVRLRVRNVARWRYPERRALIRVHGDLPVARVLAQVGQREVDVLAEGAQDPHAQRGVAAQRLAAPAAAEAQADDL